MTEIYTYKSYVYIEYMCMRINMLCIYTMWYESLHIHIIAIKINFDEGV